MRICHWSSVSAEEPLPAQKLSCSRNARVRLSIGLQVHAQAPHANSVQCFKRSAAGAGLQHPFGASIDGEQHPA